MLKLPKFVFFLMFIHSALGCDENAARNQTLDQDTAGGSDSAAADDSTTSTDTAASQDSDGADQSVTQCDPAATDACNPEEFCEVPTCADASGACVVVPTSCTKELRPVCGCDGVTYDNDCFRAAAGASLDDIGACGATACDTRDSGLCAEGEFCQIFGCGETAGACEPVPVNCTREYFPVCGCDGVTYDNDCFRRAAGASLEYSGECRSATTCDLSSSNDACAGTDTFCEVSACGAALGACQDVPTVCTREYFPVCGCDGQTYSNDCERRMAGVSLDYTGKCKTGTFCSEKGIACPSGGFCDLPSCEDTAGTCQDRPTTCTKELFPVCGCDGVTYDNDCFRIMAGVSLEHEGECPKGDACDVNQGDCTAGNFCEVQSCSDTLGACQIVETGCSREFVPVCGCDGVTYSNDCTRRASGVSLDYPGECRADLACDTGTPSSCRGGQFCETATCIDSQGSCQISPIGCSKELFPVCGCDGVTYDNDCFRLQAGVSLDYVGACR